MPPAGAPRPDRADARRVSPHARSRHRSRRARHSRNPGATALHRLNRTEYANAIRDLLAIDVDAATMLPPDDSAEGLDNIADVLGTSPALIERYVGAAGKISRLAVGDTDLGAALDDVQSPRRSLAGSSHRRSAARHPRRHRHPTQLSGRWRIPVQVFAAEGQLRAAVRRRREGRAARDERQRRAGAAPRPAIGAVLLHPGRRDRPAVRPAPLEVRLPIKAGPQTIMVTFIKKTAAYVDDLVQRFDATTADLQTGVQFGYTTVPHLSGVEILGPYSIAGPGDTPSRARIFVCRPACSRLDGNDAARRTRRTRLRQEDRVDAGAPRLSASGDRRGRGAADDLLPRRPRGRRLRQGHRDGAAPDSGGSELRVPLRTRSGERAGRRRLSLSRPRAGVAPVVFSVEQHSRRGAAEGRRAGQAEGARGARSSKSGGC